MDYIFIMRCSIVSVSLVFLLSLGQIFADSYYYNSTEECGASITLSSNSLSSPYQVRIFKSGLFLRGIEGFPRVISRVPHIDEFELAWTEDIDIVLNVQKGSDSLFDIYETRRNFLGRVTRSQDFCNGMELIDEEQFKQLF